MKVLMQISHVLKKEYKPERYEVLAIYGFWIFSIVVRVISNSPSHYIGLLAALIAAGDCLRFAVILAFRIARLLRINVLMWTPPKQK